MSKIVGYYVSTGGVVTHFATRTEAKLSFDDTSGAAILGRFREVRPRVREGEVLERRDNDIRSEARER